LPQFFFWGSFLLPYILEKLKGEGGDLILDQTGKLRILLLIILKETDAKWILYLL